jgi:hypothetical protein
LKVKLCEALASNDSKAIERDNGDHLSPIRDIHALVHVNNSQMDRHTCIVASNSSHLEGLDNGLLTIPECDISKLKAQIREIEEEKKYSHFRIFCYSTTKLI